MTIKQLSQLYHLIREIDRDKARLEALETKALSSASATASLPRAFVRSDKTERYAIMIAELKNVISANEKRCRIEYLKLVKYINRIEDSLTRRVFDLRFAECLPWHVVASRIGGGNTTESVKKRVYRYLREI
jgi:hypothetical protein